MKIFPWYDTIWRVISPTITRNRAKISGFKQPIFSRCSKSDPFILPLHWPGAAVPVCNDTHWPYITMHPSLSAERGPCETKWVQQVVNLTGLWSPEYFCFSCWQSRPGVTPLPGLTSCSQQTQRQRVSGVWVITAAAGLRDEARIKMELQWDYISKLCHESGLMWLT